MKNGFTLAVFMTLAAVVFAQQPEPSHRIEKSGPAPSMERSVQPGLAFPDYPLLQLPDGASAIVLPDAVDNAVQPFLRPVFSQQGASCGQAASVAYNFCYEINRLRGTAADTSINQYPDHFVWNFMNATAPYYGEGVSYFHTFDILYEAGTPSEAVYGPITTNDSYHWMSGYEGYFQAMHNRISGVNAIRAGTPEGLLVLKHWLHNHLADATVGGVANFYTGQAYSPMPLPEGTPEAGKHVQILYGPQATHALTIVGFNDSIRYDVNGDGQFTNDLDITGDGLVDMCDWEIGGLKFVNSYGPNWADDGFCYMLYRTLAIKYGEGGIWNNAVHVLYPDTVAKPLLTIKASIRHNKRGRLKLQAGIATDTSRYFPDQTMSFAVFNFQGGDYFMGGGGDQASKTLELGLDITPLLSHAEQGKPFRIFLMVSEKDSDHSGDGALLEASVISYSGQEPQTFASADTPLAIVDNGMTLASVVVSTGSIPISIHPEGPVLINPDAANTLQFTATGGTPPYQWSLWPLFYETDSMAPYDPPHGTLVEPTNHSNGFAAVPLPFHFPYFGKVYDTLYMHVNGYLLFDQQDMPYYYLLFDENYLCQVRAIAGYMNKDLGLKTALDSLAFSATVDSVVFSWTLENAGVRFSTTIFPDGSITHLYGSIVQPTNLLPVIGLSEGKRESTRYSKFSGTLPADGLMISYQQAVLPGQLSMQPDGLLSYEVQGRPLAETIIVRAQDAQRLTSERLITLTTGPQLTVEAIGSDTLIPPGSTVQLRVAISNLGNETLGGMALSAYAATSNATLSGNPLSNISIAPGETWVDETHFQLVISDTLHKPQTAAVVFVASQANAVYKAFGEFQVDLPVIVLSPPVITDGGNGLPDPGETIALKFRIYNQGRASAGRLQLLASTDDPFVGISGSDQTIIDELRGLSVETATYTLSINTSAPPGRVFRFNLSVLKGDSLLMMKSFELPVGQSPIAVIDLDGNHNSALHIAAAINALGVSTDRFSLLESELFNYKYAFLSLGFIPYNHVIKAAEDSLMVSFLDQGGRLYVEGGRFFKFDPPTMLRARMHVSGSDSAYYHPADTLLGYAGTPAEGIQFDYRGEWVMGENLLAIAPAVPWLTDKNTGLDFTVALDSAYYKTIASSFEFGGTFMFDSPERPEMIRRYLKFLGYDVQPLAANFKADKKQLCPGNTVHFEPFCSGQPLSYHWTFEGGTPDQWEGANPVITYNIAGVYGVSLTVTDASATNTFSLDEMITVEACLGLNETEAAFFSMLPNPASNKLSIVLAEALTSGCTISFYDMRGQCLVSRTLAPGTRQLSVGLQSLLPGCYLVVIENKKLRHTQKLLVY
ncbi:MAG: PKD domain-containing protein [Bacteroidetes bacterium]|nr:PKD domain-containing protein [Bacteroidota bacterium]